jgi:hypothetical protein
MRGSDWTRAEVEAVVADYFSMLTDELAGVAVNKTEHRRRLAQLLMDRSDASIERKHQNISAILIELGLPYIDGYKPLGNYQGLLAEVVEDRVAVDGALQNRLVTDLSQPVLPPSVDDILDTLVPVPELTTTQRKLRERPRRQVRPRRGVNYLELEARNAELGKLGEEFVINFERAWLIIQGRERLANRVEQVSVSQGDGLGYDVLSFEPDGRERLLEVKTTKYGRYIPFFATPREVDVSERDRDKYHLCRVFDFRERPQFYRVSGSIRRAFQLDPAQYIARIA